MNEKLLKIENLENPLGNSICISERKTKLRENIQFMGAFVIAHKKLSAGKGGITPHLNNGPVWVTNCWLGQKKTHTHGITKSAILGTFCQNAKKK